MKKNNPELYQRVIAFLNRQQVDSLDKIGKDALFSKGAKLSRVKIISCLVDLLRELDINGEDISSLEDLKARIKEKIISNYPTTKELLIHKDQANPQSPGGRQYG